MNKVIKSMTGKLFFIVCIQCLLGLQQVYATTYYVSPTGIDSDDGLSLSTPVRTITNALSKATLSGDIIYVLTGIYVEAITIRQSGIILSAYPDNKPVIDGETTLPAEDWSALITVKGNYNTISGFEVKNSDINHIYSGNRGIEVIGHHNLVSKVDVHHIANNGILLDGDYNTVEDSSIWQCSREDMNDGGTSGWGTGMSAARNSSSSALKNGITSYAVFRHNTVFNNWGEGLSCYEADHCIMEDNIVYDNWTVNLYLSDATNSLVQRNIIYVSTNPAIPTRNNTHPPAILLADEVLTAPRSANNAIINNFIYNANLDAFSWTQVANSGLNNVLIANNTLVDSGLFTGYGGDNAIVNSNSQIRNNIILGSDSNVPNNSGIIFSNNNWSVTPDLAKSATDIIGDPKIARTGKTTEGSLTADYFKVLPNSPVINAAMPLSNVTEDFFRTFRGNTVPDIGGHELLSSECTTTPPPNVQPPAEVQPLP